MNTKTKNKTDGPPPNPVSRDCPICNCADSNALPQYSLQDWIVRACDSCKFVYLKNPPGYEALIDQYSWEKTSVEETERRLQIRSISAKISKSSRWRLSLLRLSRTKINHYFNEGNVLDIGCGFGGRILDAKGIPHGIEISRELNEQANENMKPRGGYSIHAPAVEGVKQFPDDYFDSVLMHSFLEHEENPSELLDGVLNILKPGGHAYVRVPNYGSVNRIITGKKWCGFRYPDHVNYFTVSSLKNLARNKGFEFKLLNPLNIMFDDNIKALLVKH